MVLSGTVCKKMVRNMVNSLWESDLSETEKNTKIDNVLNDIKKEFSLLDVNFDSALKESIFFCCDKIKYYKKMTERSGVDYSVPLLCLGVGIVCPLLAYYFYATRGEAIKSIEQELLRSGAISIYSSMDYASCYGYFDEDNWKMQLLLNRLVLVRKEQAFKDIFIALTPLISCFFVEELLFLSTSKNM